ncbi:MAG: penicillin acylase family protein [Pacificimonas sp.]|jgi:acyl-homoserine-lactone acylase|nr:penicillin acylase family protein [Pacificimonas sp.]
MHIVGKLFIGLAFLIAAILFGLMIWDPLTPIRSEAPPVRTYDVEIVRDDYGVPHVFGETDADTAYGVAWAHSEDDFTTIQDSILMAKGRFGTVAGTDGAVFDYIHALLGSRATAADYYDQMPADIRAMMEAYAAGLNAFAEAHPHEIKRAGIFPVGAEDMLAGSITRAPFFMGLDSVLRALTSNEEPGRWAVTDVTEARGSNAFAVSPAGSTDGYTRLVVNSHQPWTGPVAWWEVRVKSKEGLDAAGSLFPGTFVPLHGHNQNLGWARTVNRPDLIDVYKLVLNEDGTQYRFGNEWLPLKEETAWLRVKFGPLTIPVPRAVHRSVHGPVIVNDLGAYAVRYAGIGNPGAVEQDVALIKARNFEEFTSAMAMQKVHATNYIYADREGNIGLFYNASIPDRSPDYDWPGILPGDDPDALWTETIAYEAVPKVVNPPSGFIGNANNAPYFTTFEGENLKPSDFPQEYGIEDRITARSLRFFEMLAEDEDRKFSREELLAMKFDKTYTKNPESWVKQLWDRAMALDTAGDEALAEAQALFRSWDWTSDGQGEADAFAAYFLQLGANQGRTDGPEAVDVPQTLRDTSDALKTHFGTLTPPLTDVLRVRRGNMDVGTTGGVEALRAIYSTVADDGRLVGAVGDSFIMFVEWGPDGEMTSSSVHNFGSAVERPGSEHYNSQVEMFAEERWKPALLPEEDVRAKAASIYRPG